MPIRPEMKERYPADWPQIRAGILRRAEGRCEQCGVVNHSWGYRNALGEFVELDAADLRRRGYRPGSYIGLHRIIMIVLTIAHIKDPDPANCAPENLAALCQRCHNTHDAALRATTRRETFRARRAIAELFGLALCLGILLAGCSTMESTRRPENLVRLEVREPFDLALDRISDRAEVCGHPLAVRRTLEGARLNSVSGETGFVNWSADLRPEGEGTRIDLYSGNAWRDRLPSKFKAWAAGLPSC